MNAEVRMLLFRGLRVAKSKSDIGHFNDATDACFVQTGVGHLFFASAEAMLANVIHAIANGDQDR